ncbi:MAG: hypothetical protein A2Y62_18240 [Candidatus Fischerbacteria bacterium RBG_13_37_8]|uniref:Glycosyltransferase RgtA/B/C/D-like domain-containing protein n=1 Tax=Candidatus Fischerbacteria bacterium RBG_13_37_8 TaxID=1817863 RepID=A0A1F5VVK0_9BACT|nr:MAG: hypothetical protein A2Y62_18240 [Candidatus Fischerbacteria bacterium RBG_13_37_8]
MMKKKKTVSKKTVKAAPQWLTYIFFVAVLIVLLYPRIYPYKDKLAGEIFFKDPDTCYHARRIIYCATHNLQMPFYDPLLAHPHGAIPMWSPLYDWLSAIPSFLLGFGKPSATMVMRTSVLLTLLYGLAALLLTGLLLYRATGQINIAILGAFLVGITDPQIKYTSIEIIDHNSLLIVLFSLLLYLGYLFMRKAEQENILKLTIAISLLTAMLFWVWSGSYLFAATLAGIFFLYVLLRKKIWLLRYMALLYAISAVAIIPLAMIHYKLGKEMLRFEYVSLFTVLFLFSIALFFYLISAIAGIKSSTHKVISALKITLLLILLVSALYACLQPLLQGMQFTRAENAWVSTIAESKPLLYQARGSLKIFTFSKAVNKLSYLFFVFPVAFILLLFKRIKIPLELYVILIVCSVLFGFLAFSQQKFAVEFSIPFGMVLALFIGWLYQKLTSGFSIVLLVIFVIALTGALLPLKKTFIEKYTPFYGYYPAFKWLKTEAGLKNTEINTGHIQPFGAMAPWDIGHHLQLYSQMPVVTDNFGPYLDQKEGLFDMVRFFLAEDEKIAIEILKRYRCRYVVVTFSSIFEQYAIMIGIDSTVFHQYSIIEQNGEKRIATIPQERFFNTVGLRLGDLYGSANPTPDENMFAVKALKHFRLIHESLPSISAGQEIPAGALKIYEYVEGEQLHIDVPGNPFYKLEGVIETNTGNRFYYRQSGYVNDKIIVPYPTKQHKDYPYALYYKVTAGSEQWIVDREHRTGGRGQGTGDSEQK